MPPDVRAFGAATFEDQQRLRLTAWLREPAWPREHMDIVGLEGYLVALIAWPVGIPTGAWLPPIWGGRGWRVPTKIAARSQFEEFVSLVVGFMRELDRQLTQQPSRFESSLLRELNARARVAGLQSWGRGFMSGLALGSQGLKWRSASAATAVRIIAANTSASAPLGPNAIDDVLSAVLALMAQRSSRGPLGPLESVAAPKAPMASSPKAGPSTDSRGAGARSV
jgi:yecA family protein